MTSLTCTMPLLSAAKDFAAESARKAATALRVAAERNASAAAKAIKDAAKAEHRAAARLESEAAWRRADACRIPLEPLEGFGGLRFVRCFKRVECGAYVFTGMAPALSLDFFF